MKWTDVCLLGVGVSAGIAAVYGLLWYLHCAKKAKEILKKEPIQLYYNKVKERESYCPLDEVSKVLQFVIVFLEDKRFFKHHGIDILRILKAVCINLASRRKKMGGSTITQQLAKNMYLSFEKRLERKVVEFILTKKLERELTKQEILDLYLNIIYYAQSNYCVKDACWYFFRKKPSEVSLNQAITLGCVLPAPTAYDPLVKESYFDKAKLHSLRIMQQKQFLTEEDIQMFMSVIYKDELRTERTKELEERFAAIYDRSEKKRKTIYNIKQL